MQSFKQVVICVALLVSQTYASNIKASLIGGGAEIAHEMGKYALAGNAALKTGEIVGVAKGGADVYSIGALAEGAIVEASSASVATLVTGAAIAAEVVATAAGKLVDASVARGIAEIDLILTEAIAASLATLNGAAYATTGIVKGAARSIDAISSSTANQANFIVDGAAFVVDNSLNVAQLFINLFSQGGEMAADIAADVSSGLLRGIGNAANLKSIILTHY